MDEVMNCSFKKKRKKIFNYNAKKNLYLQNDFLLLP